MENNLPRIDPNTILTAEYDYIVQTAMQANEDRARVSNYYLAAAGAAVAAIIGAGFDSPTPPGVTIGFSLLFAGLGVIGILTLLQLARLRRAWRESVVAMNQLKDYYIAHCREIQLEKAFAWRGSTIPPAAKRNSLAYLLALSVILIASASLSAAYVYLCLTLDLPSAAQFMGAAAVFIAAGWFQLKIYDRWVG
ncbi:hypothetical protein LARV_03624 [Longilinea arvoryzae]|uniref:Uncharacterized protein n=1 Tax=Longilinea arvoryzae TaxID=360412 RepID=A0A0S7BDD3_9CHLR|nr:hypothetical protein [Longilinea arvoryzae]GAP15831.1 hypothetical protein LARV_03624 [Longilinea arvoryzae]